MINPARKAMRRAKILLASLSDRKYADKQIRRYSKLVDCMKSDEFRNYIVAMGKTVGMLPTERVEEDERMYLAEVPDGVLNNANEMTDYPFGSEKFKQGLAGLILSLQATLRAQERIDEIYRQQ